LKNAREKRRCTATGLRKLRGQKRANGGGDLRPGGLILLGVIDPKDVGNRQERDKALTGPLRHELLCRAKVRISTARARYKKTGEGGLGEKRSGGKPSRHFTGGDKNSPLGTGENPARQGKN